ncbi:RNB domain-containing ribonuclease [Demequina lutea]|uniref:Exoribonuclease R n=1 Tax=Demequina lutea TaxID=431489 RepID=A0A7Y9ZAW3_9MICO|nr:RNB domain-containing ribonuclease [Demequina lutea]NYI41435.1 exoribonuclease R [Demequina lutea]
MPIRRLVARTSLTQLEHRFAEIRSDEGIHEERSAGVLAELARGGRDEEPAHIEGKRDDLTDVSFVTIDPEGSTDLDQAVLVEVDGQGWRVRYAIADVAAHVVPGGAIDTEAWARVETTYCPDERIGLHPLAMSEGYASLLPGQRTKAVVWDLGVDAAGELRTIDMRRAWVRSTHKYSYEQLTTAPPKDAMQLLTNLKKLGDARRSSLARAGAVSLPKPSQEVVRKGDELTLEFRAGRPIEDDNAQVSLLTGSAAARLMLEAGVGVLRTMPPASEAALQRLRHQAAALGVEWAPDESYAHVLTTLNAESPRGAAFLTAAVSLFRGAAWQPFDVAGGMPVPDPVTHGALSAPYAHVTAPLRRLVDRYGTEVCLAHAAGRQVPDWVVTALPGLGTAMETGVRRGSRVDRACVDAVEAAVLAPHVGEMFEGVGLDSNTVQLSAPAVVAKCSGTVTVGRRQHVRLVSADAATGPKFEAAS